MTWFDSSLPWIAAVGALVAAVCGFAAAVFTGVAAQATAAQVELERKPVLVLSGTNESLVGLQRQKRAAPPNVLFVRPDGTNIMVPMNTAIPTMTADGHLYQPPPFFSRLILTNAGRLPLVDIVVGGDAKFFDNASKAPNAFAPQEAEKVTFSFAVPWLAPGGTYEFAIATLSKPGGYTFSRKITVTRIDTEKQAEVSLFVARGFGVGEGSVGIPFDLPLAPDPRHPKK